MSGDWTDIFDLFLASTAKNQEVQAREKMSICV